MVQSTLSSTQQRLVRAFGNWQIALLVIDPDNRKPLGWPWIGGCSIRPGHPAEPGDWHEYDTKGIRILTADREVRHSVSWGAIRIHCRSLPGWLREAVRANAEERRRAQVEYVPFRAPAEAVGCGRPPGIGPMTREQALYDDAYQQWKVEVEEPQRARMNDLYDELDRLLADCFPLADGLCRCSACAIPHVRIEGCVAA